ncbi:SAM-dependent methyltransferase [Nitrosomonas sp. Nm58]|jgi:16S rRNA (cytidine1402-2'-O)-methyltransferase|uniref:SAM-dependent methyltransferase n=1 Tax=Nitrosomonas sp. Nm58 TaxID=200126 RepID=UPI0008987C9C|nr:SAM-dependent methyltransferase [Nitrosomonas sp. Nm58]SDY78898.1 16S rRNA (cytidine1402-2'-O)-methyltransferase [Nitrosomonas sp. Nm58]
MHPGTLFLIPAPLGEVELAEIIPENVQQRIARLKYFIVEHPKTARHFLKRIGCIRPLQEIEMQVLNEHTGLNEIDQLLEPLLAGNDIGLLSEAGCPAVADPGANLVRAAHQKHASIVPLVGPSSILLALMASGLNGQGFRFHGYLPIKNELRIKKIIQLDEESARTNQTQIFIETPYRNQKLLEILVQNCSDETDLCIASNLTLKDQYIVTKKIKAWRSYLPEINKKPTVFLLCR